MVEVERTEVESVSWFDENGNGDRIDVPKLLDSKCGEGIAELVNLGALVSLGLTSDGGALGVTVTVDGKWRREYFRDEDAMLVWISGAIPGVAAEIEGKPLTSVSRLRPRSRRTS